MEVKYQLTPNDYYLFRWYWWLHKSKMKPWMLVALASLISSLPSIPIILHQPSPFGLWICVPLCLISFGLISLIFVLAYKPLMKWTAKLIPGLLNPRHLIISEACLTEHTSVAEIKVKWSRIAALEETGAALYFFLNSSNAFIIPKRVFVSPAEAQNFLAFSRQWWETGNGEQNFSVLDSGSWPPPPRGQ